jgi:hypothetical protein
MAYEPQLDGLCEIGRKSARSAQPRSRNRKDFTGCFPGVMKGIAKVPANTMLMA